MNAKQIRFYRNGDRYFAGLKLAVSPERYKEFDSLLVELSEKLDLSSGAVRFIFNAEDGSLITDISQLQYGISYVCSSSNVLRQMNDGYGKHLHSNWAASQRTRSNSSKNMTSLSGGLLSVDISFNAGRSECSKDYIKPKLVTVIRNGKPPQTKVTLLLNSKTALSYEKVLDQLSARGSLGKVDKLYSVDGRQVVFHFFYQITSILDSQIVGISLVNMGYIHIYASKSSYVPNYSKVPNSSPPPLINFRKFFGPPPVLIRTPPFINFRKFQFQHL